jgi:2',3'-cyclic-nucleotide 2'-phosphodiesterase (5'-nucleotidase family)
MPYDILTVRLSLIDRAELETPQLGNHELYRFEVAKDVATRFVPKWDGRYLASNVDITLDGVRQPFASRFRRWRTERGLRIFSMGVIFDFKLPAAGLHVQSPQAMLLERWFLNEMERGEAVDTFVLVGHMAVYDVSWRAIVKTVRRYYPETPMCDRLTSDCRRMSGLILRRLLFGGHAHVRDCSRPDKRSLLMAAGRYMETVGWASTSSLAAVRA